MVHTYHKVLVSAGLVFCLFSSIFAYSGGSGTEADPYQIGTVSDWINLMNTQTDWDANFIMTADIDLQGVPLIPVGNDINEIYIYFSGVFDGNGHTIRNASINIPVWHIGLFGVTDYNSQIRNLGVEDVNMSGRRCVAGLVGCSAGTIIDCYATGKVSQNFPGTGFGGLVGKNYGTIMGCYAACDVNGGVGETGGLVGVNLGAITDCHATGTISGQNNHIGGLVGNNIAVDINYIGTITRCYATGSVSGYKDIGGLVGFNGDNAEGFFGWCLVTDCYATGAVTGTWDVGGLIGYNEFGHATDCYAAGIVSGNSDVGGLIGRSVPAATNCFWDVETSGQTTSAGGIGMTTAEMMTLSTFTSAGWDFVDTWGIGENQTYPFLRTYSGTDLNYDGLVNLIDFAVLANHWLEGI